MLQVFSRSQSITSAPSGPVLMLHRVQETKEFDVRIWGSQLDHSNLGTLTPAGEDPDPRGYSIMLMYVSNLFNIFNVHKPNVPNQA